MSRAAVAVSLTLGLGCRGEPVALESTPATALRQQFPERAALVLEQGEIFVATGEGFALEKPPASGAFRGVELALPREGGEAIRFHGLGGADVAVREVGARGEGVVAERAVAYRRAGGTSFWMAAKEGVEEWLHLEASAVRAGEPVAAWEIEGATVRQRGEGVELIDGSGMVRLAVTAPKAYAVGGGEIDAWLVGIGAWIELHVDASGEAVLVDPLWVPVGSMAQARGWHTATLLGSGKVLVVGGYDSNAKSFPASTELYDPATSAWTPAASMSQGRGYHTATLLADGTVLVAGGCCAPGDLASAERYDPPTNTWSAAGAMSQVRRVHVAARLVNGKVLVAGGYDEVNCLSTAELYDPVTNTWSPTAPMSQARDFFAATSLPDGKVLVAGGFQAGFDVAVASAELYDPATNTWSPAGALAEARANHTMTLLIDGRVLAAGGGGDGGGNLSLSSAELYDPATNTWSFATSMSQARLGAATRLGSGKVLQIGGYTGGSFGDVLASTELYDPVTNTWSVTSTMNQPRSVHTATLLGNGDVLVAGGYTTGPMFPAVASAELYATSGPLGTPCSVPGDCKSGFCADGVCCDSACDVGVCAACSLAAGAAVNGTCAALTGPVCNDGNGCTQMDTCQAGACVGANPVVCEAIDECHGDGACDSSTGVCSTPSQPDGTPCAHGACSSGVCSPAPTSTSSGNSSSGDGSGSGSGSGSGGSGSGGSSSSSGSSSSASSPATGSATGGGGSDGSGGGSGGPDTSGGCGCGVIGAPDLHPAWLGFGLLLARRRRARRAPSPREEV